jgi:Ser/Thr protein kinase RdoA (MazF antagonist)
MTKTFDSLTRDAQLRHLRLCAKRALSTYGINGATLRLLRYEDNVVYRVDSSSGLYSLRISVRDGRPFNQQESEITWLAKLHEAGLPVPQAVTTLNGNSVAEVENERLKSKQTAALFRWIPGKVDPSFRSPRVARGLGEITGMLHRQSDLTLRYAELDRPKWGFEDVFQRGFLRDTALSSQMLDDEDRNLISSIGHELSGIHPPSGTEWGLIHADLHLENVLNTPGHGHGHGQGLAVIDFDDCGFGHFMLDIGTVLSSTYRRSSTASEYLKFADRFLGGYTEIRALPRSFDRLSDFLVMRDMIILNFVIESRNPTVASWRLGRIHQIIDQMRSFSATGNYPGSL